MVMVERTRNSCNSRTTQVWLNPLPSLSHGEVMIDYVINDCCTNFIRASYTNATSPDRGPSTSTTAFSLSSSYSLLRLLVATSSIHAWYQLQTIDLFYRIGRAHG